MDHSAQEFFRDFYNEHKKLIYYLALQHTPPGTDLDDLVQDVVLRLLDYIPTLMKLHGSKNRLVAYLSLTVRSVYVDRLRSDPPQRITIIPMEMLDSICEDEALHPSPISHMAAHWDVALLQEHLSSRDWNLLTGKYMMGYSDQELARHHGCSADSVRMLLSRARKNAKILLQDRTGGESDV